MNINPQRVIIYIDGFNFYHGLKSKKWRRYYWLDVVKFFESFIKSHQLLVAVYYFSAVPKDDKGQIRRQQAFFSANKLNPKFNLVLGQYKRKNIKLRDGSIHSTFEEKETDVRIATQMIGDVVKDKCDLSILVSADSDLMPPIEFIKEYKPLHKILVYFPPNRESTELKFIGNKYIHLERHEDRFRKNMLNDEISLLDGTKLYRPKHWN